MSGVHLICGEALYDVFVDEQRGGPEGQVLLRAVAGGSPFNVAVGMARLGASVGLASDIAQDVLGERIVTQLAEEAVVDLFLRRTAPATALAFVTTDGTGTPSYSFSGLEQAYYCPEEDIVDQNHESIRGIHIGSIATVLPNSARPLLDLARRFADRAMISLDPNIRLSIVPDPAIWHNAIEHLRYYCQLVKVSEEDIATLYGDRDADALCHSWLNDRTTLIVLTRGAEGATLFTRSAGRVDIPPVGTVVVDTVGAGDSFMAAFLSRMTQNGWDSSEKIASLTVEQLYKLGSFAALAAAVTCARRGPVLPYSLELAAIDATSVEVGD